MRTLVSLLVCMPALLAQESHRPRTGAAGSDPSRGVDHAALDAILQQTVRDELVDYLAVRDHHGPQLRAYLDTMAEVEVGALPEAQQLAYWFNVYNASMIAAVVERLRADWSPAKDDYAVFKEKLVRARGKVLSLDHVEHEILRKKFTEPRLHVALVCAARSCPPLLARAYRGDDLDAVLAGNMRRFVNDPTRNEVDHEAKKLNLSRIFDWFKADFGGEPGVKELVGHHLGRDVSGYRLSFLDYDWRLNLAPPRTGWIAAAAQNLALSSQPLTDDVVAEVPSGALLHAIGERDGMVEVVVPGRGSEHGFAPSDSVRRR
jgi:hypothetical protein